MAIVQNPLINRASGAVGNSVFSKWKNRNVLKSKSINPYPSPTPAQVAARAIFKNCIDFQLPIKPYWPYICKSKQIKLSPSNFFVKQNRNLFTAGTDIILLDNIKYLNFCYGNLPCLSLEYVTFNSSLDYTISTNLPYFSDYSLLPSRSVFYVVDSFTKELFVFYFEGTGCNSVNIVLPASCLSHLCFFFCSFYNDTYKISSISTFLTSLIIN